MNDIKKNIRIVFWLFFIMFLILIGYILFFVLVRADTMINSGFNPRVRINDPNIQRGEIRDRNGEVLAYSEQTQEGFVRRYPYDRAFAHVVGYVGMSHAGVEERYNFNLTNLSLEIIQRLDNIARGGVLVGDNLSLTINANLQRFAYDRLGNNRGSIVVLDPHTGEVLTMVSSPSFNPELVTENWSTLISDEENSPLLNRATQGLYAPGSTFKILTAAAAIELEIEDFIYDDTGEITIEGNTIRNFNSVPHGEIDLKTAFAVSSNAYFVALAELIGIEEYITQINKFFKPIEFSLAHSQSQFNLSPEDNIADLMQTAIGQGQTLVTPLYMASLTSAIANGGKLISPRITKSSNVLQTTHQIFSDRQVEILNEIMIEVVENGTGTNATIENYQLAGKTGTAENNAGESHGWFVGYAPAENAKFVIVVMLEHAGGSGATLPIVRDVLNHAFEITQ